MGLKNKKYNPCGNKKRLLRRTLGKLFPQRYARQEAEQAAKWFYEYNEIYTIVDIAFDYLLEAKKILNEAINREGKNIEEAASH